MIRENKLKYLISSIIIILPFVVSLFVKSAINNMMMGAWYFTWIMPLVLLALHTGLLILTRYIDPVKQSAKVENMIFFMVPSISLYTGAIFIAIMLGLEFNISMVCAFIIGISFIVMGNYIPKAKRNRTFGLKIKWTLANDDNWGATHRFSGKVFVIAGLLTLGLAFAPMKVFFIGLTVLLVLIVAIPIVYSYSFYKKQLETGAATEEDYKNTGTFGKKGKIAVTVTLVATCAVVLAMMFLGNLKFEFSEDALSVKPTMGGGIELKYSELCDADIKYCDEKIPGSRVMGYGSAKLLYGQFHNDDFGNYTRYTYTQSESAIVIKLDDEIIVIAAETTEETYALYKELILRIDALD